MDQISVCVCRKSNAIAALSYSQSGSRMIWPNRLASERFRTIREGAFFAVLEKVAFVSSCSAFP